MTPDTDNLFNMYFGPDDIEYQNMNKTYTKEDINKYDQALFVCPKCKTKTNDFSIEKTRYGPTFYCNCNNCHEEWVAFGD